MSDFAAVSAAQSVNRRIAFPVFGSESWPLGKIVARGSGQEHNLADLFFVLHLSRELRVSAREPPKFKACV